MKVRRQFIAIVSIFMFGCTTIGPSVVPVEQFNYNAAIARSSAEQILLNLVRARYGEYPVFLRVNSVISQYSVSGNASAGAGLNTGFTGRDTASIGAGGTWTQSPTITYTPVSGKEFARDLLVPLPPVALLELIQAGWPSQPVLGLTTWSVNGINNEIARPTNRRQADANLHELVQAWDDLHRANVLGIRNRTADLDEGDVVLYLREGPHTEDIAANVAKFRKILNLAEDTREFRVVYGLTPESDDEIALLTGSVYDIMTNLAWRIDVPDEHIASGRTDAAFRSSREGRPPPIDLTYSKEKPPLSFVAVKTQDYWFYIRQEDLKSKQSFMFLQLLIGLTEAPATSAGPAVTIGN